MRLRGVGRLRHWLRRATALLRSEAVILLYHRVYDASIDTWRLSASPAQFAEHLEHLRRYYSVMSLRGLAAGLATGQVPRRAVAVTFDDGYADNALLARPLLEQNGVPATIAITTGCVSSDREFWWDELERVVFLTPVLPAVLELPLNGTVLRCALGDSAGKWMANQHSLRRWSVFRNEDPTPRHRAYRELYWALRPLPYQRREAALETLRQQAGTTMRGRESYRIMTTEELRRLAASELIEIAAHTVTHPMLSAMPGDVQRWEMTESRRFLEDIIGKPVTSFCYPYGLQADVGDTAVELARSVGFQIACSAVPGVVRRGTDPLWLPRFLVGAWEGDMFARRLRMFFA